MAVDPGGPSRSARLERLAASHATRAVNSTGSRRPAGRRWSRPASRWPASDRHPAWHLHDREQRIETLQRRALHRNAQHREHGMGGHHPRQMCGPTGTRDQHLDPAGFRARREFGHPHGRPMRRNDMLLVGDAKTLQHIDGVLHRLPIGRRTHDDGDKRIDSQIGNVT